MRLIILLLFIHITVQNVYSQTFLNGSFENTTAVSDQINLSNVMFDAVMSNTTAFGTSGNMDIISSTTWGGGGAQNGTFYTALTGSGTDAIAMELSAPLIAGNTYSISFYDRKDASFVSFPISIGLSNSNTTFGTIIYTAPSASVTNVWTQRSFCFVAPITAQYITVQMVGGGTSNWTHIDNFTFSTPNATFSFPNFCAGSVNGPTGIVNPGGTFSFNPVPGDGSTINATTGVMSNAINGTTYSVQYTTSGACPSSSIVQVTVNGFSYSSTVVDENCGAGDGSIDLVPIGGLAPFNYSLNSGANQGNGLFTGLTVGNYTVLITDDSGCTATGIESITGSNLSIDNLNVIDPSCAGVCDGSITAVVSGGQLPYNYEWFNGSMVQIGGNTATISGLCAGNYSLTVTDAGGTTSQLFFEDFESGASGWNLSSVQGGEGADPNFFVVNDNEGGVAPGGCGIAGNGDATLHITSTFFPFGGAAYDAGGLCGLLFCPQTNRQAESPLISTVGQTGLTLSFDFIAQGDIPNDQATVWYNDGFGWTQLGTPLFSGTGACAPQGIWTAYSSVLPASCENITNLQIAIRWVNNDDGAGSDPSVAINNISIDVSGLSSCNVVAIATLTDPLQADPTFTFADYCNGEINGPTGIITPGGIFAFNPIPTDGATINATTGVISNAVSGSTYSVEYSTPGTCVETHIESVLVNAIPSPTITGDLIYCTGSNSILDAGPGYSSYLWSTGATTQTITTTAQTGITVTVTNLAGCSATSTAIDVVEQNSISTTGQEIICEGDVILIHGMNESVAGFYTVMTTSVGGCDSTSTIELIVNPRPLIDGLTILTELCFGNNDASIEIVSVINNIGTLSYSWNIIPDPSASLASNLAPGTYNVTITDNTTLCFSDSSIVVAAGPICCDISLTTQSVVDANCLNDGSITLAATGGDGNYFYSINNGVYVTSNTFSNLAPGSYQLIVHDGTVSCADTIYVDLLGNTAPIVNSVATQGVGCTTPNSGTATVDVAPGQGDLAYNLLLNGQSIQLNTTGIFTGLTSGYYSLEVMNASGCLTTIAVTITEEIPTRALFTFGPHPITLFNPYLVLTNDSENGATYIWEITGENGYSQTYSSYEPLHTFPSDTGTYEVCLTAISFTGCIDVTCKTVVVKDDGYLFVPNSFTPDGNELNQEFKPIILGFDNSLYDFYIYNRWGELIFESHDINSGWDGTYKGVLSQSGTYVWRIKAKNLNAKQSREYMGHVNLLK